jgi:UDP-glucose 4-epimerase
MGRAMNVLVTGGAGFIGSHTVTDLLEAGHEVAVWDNMSTGKLANLSGMFDRVRLEEGDVRDLEALQRFAEASHPDAVLHLAAIPSVLLSLDDPPLTNAVNLTGSVNVLEVARRLGIRRVVLASSAAVYGEDPRMPWAETMSTKPSSPYGLQKWQSEEYALLYTELYGVDTICLRYFNVFGPRQDPNSGYSGVISIFHDRLHRHEQPVIFGTGMQTRDFVYVADVARANRLALECPTSGHHAINIATGREITILKLLQALGEIAGVLAEPEFRESRRGEVPRSVASVAEAKSLLGFTANYSLEQGLVLLSDSYREQR